MEFGQFAYNTLMEVTENQYIKDQPLKNTKYNSKISSMKKCFYHTMPQNKDKVTGEVEALSQRLKLNG